MNCTATYNRVKISSVPTKSAAGEVTTGKASKLEIVSKPKWVGVSVLFPLLFYWSLSIYASAARRAVGYVNRSIEKYADWEEKNILNEKKKKIENNNTAASFIWKWRIQPNRMLQWINWYSESIAQYENKSNLSGCGQVSECFSSLAKALLSKKC